jgi:hypothetical protein
MNKMLNGVLVAMTDEEIAEFNARKASEPTEEERWLENRIGEYPSLQECIHAILDDELDALQAKRAAVKAKYPKS